MLNKLNWVTRGAEGVNLGLNWVILGTKHVNMRLNCVLVDA